MTDYLYLDIGVDCALHMMQCHKDYEGNARYVHYHFNRAKGFNYNESSDTKFYNGGYLIPCDRRVTDAIRNFIEAQRLMLPVEEQEWNARGPYYFTLTMQRDPELERAEQGALLMGGPDTAYAAEFEDERGAPKRHWLLAAIFGERAEVTIDQNKNKLNIPLARYNCWTATQGIAQYIGGVDLSRITPELATAHRAWMAEKTLGTETDRIANAPAAAGAQHIGNGQWLVQAKDTPPYLIVRGSTTFRNLMTLEVPGTGEKLGAWMDKQDVFTRTAPSTHLHTKVKTPEPA